MLQAQRVSRVKSTCIWGRINTNSTLTLQIIEEVGSSPLPFDEASFTVIFNHRHHRKWYKQTTFLTNKDAEIPTRVLANICIHLWCCIVTIEVYPSKAKLISCQKSVNKLHHINVLKKKNICSPRWTWIWANFRR